MMMRRMLRGIQIEEFSRGYAYRTKAAPLALLAPLVSVGRLMLASSLAVGVSWEEEPPLRGNGQIVEHWSGGTRSQSQAK